MKLNKARELLTEMYIKSLQEETLPWRKGWELDYHQFPVNPVSNTRYKGVNNFLLSFISLERNYKDPRWLTFNQIKQQGYSLEDAKGKGVPVEFWSTYDTKNKVTVSLIEYRKIIDTYPARAKDFKVMDRVYFVFNAEHIKGIPKLQQNELPKKLKDASPFIDNVIKNMGVKYEEFGNRACYLPAKDTVFLPASNQFESQYAYESTKLHELCHATGHSSRLDRKVTNSFDTADYAREELRAEIASSFLAREVAIKPSQTELENHKAYIQNWIKTLQTEPNELFKSIKDAEKISDYVLEVGEVEKFQKLEQGIVDEPEALDVEEYLARQGLASPISNALTDKLKGNRQLKTAQGEKKFLDDTTKEIDDYHDRRAKAIKEYSLLVEEGKVRPKTSVERTLETAQGNAEKESVQAARRILAKRGYNWKTGEKLFIDLEKPRIFVDMDGVEAHFNNTIESLDILHEKGYYRHLVPQINVVKAVNQLIDKYPGQVYILSAVLSSPHAQKDKIAWVKEFNPKLAEDHLILCPYGQPKTDYVPGGIKSTDFLLDDYTNNLVLWENSGGQAVKLVNNINHTNQSWGGPTVDYKDMHENIISTLEDLSFSNKKLLYHGSPSLFQNFSADKIGAAGGTDKGYGFYFSMKQEEALLYSQGEGYLYQARLKPGRELSYNQLTIDRDELSSILDELPNADRIDIVSNYGDISTSGLASIKQDCLDSLMQYSNSDAELIGDLANQLQNKKEIISIFAAKGYTHYVADDNSYIVIDDKALEIQRVWTVNENGEKFDVQNSKSNPVISIDVRYQNDDFASIKESAQELNRVFEGVLSSKKAEIRVSLSKDGEDVLKNERIDYRDLLEHQKAIHDCQENSLITILKDKAKQNILLHQDKENLLRKYAVLDELLQKMEVILVEEQFISVGSL